MGKELRLYLIIRNDIEIPAERRVSAALARLEREVG